MISMPGIDRCKIDINGADKKIRTSDLRITNAPLYQLSYAGTEGRQVYVIPLSGTIPPRSGIYLQLVRSIPTTQY